jgi:hypothetical protein
MFDVPWNEMAFDSQEWKSKEVYPVVGDSEYRISLKRGLMLYDLFDDHIRIGMTMDRARELARRAGQPGQQRAALAVRARDVERVQVRDGLPSVAVR